MSFFQSRARAEARDIGRDFVRRADEARDSRCYPRAAFLYEEALRHLPHRGDLHVQHGHMLKETGDLDGAELAYRRAAERMPDDADLALQMAHLFKSQGQIARAEVQYRRALTLRPAWAEAERELASLAKAGWCAVEPEAGMPLTRDSRAPAFAAGELLQLSSDLAPRAPIHTLVGHGEEIAPRGLGRRERTAWGVMHVFRGVRAIRGFCISAVPVLTIELFLNKQLVYRGGLAGGYVLPHERDNPQLRRYTFNVWIDLAGFATARYDLHYRAIRIDGTTIERTEAIVIAPDFPPSPLLDSDDAVLPADPADPRSLEAQINARPSMVRSARRAMLSTLPKTVLVQRVDALGDLVVAVPALRRLRQLLVGAKLVGVLSPANVDFARTLGLFDEIIVADMVFDPWDRRRVVPIEAQEKLVAELARYSFDMAIDLSKSGDSRMLLPLSQAPVLVGFSADSVPNLTVEVSGAARDPYNNIENVPHSNHSLGLIEWLAAMMRNEPTVVPRDDLTPEPLGAFGLSAEDRFVILHAGGRWPFTRWPHFLELAQMLLDRTDLRVVLLTSDPAAGDTLPEALSKNERFQVLNRRLAFDELDALVTYCALFVGDDSGVKHLASARRTKVIGIQNARNNWSEWGQENGGYIITRKVPCAGCLIQNYPDSDECGREFVCITGIRSEEVFDASMRLLEGME